MPNPQAKSLHAISALMHLIQSGMSQPRSEGRRWTHSSLSPPRHNIQSEPIPMHTISHDARLPFPGEATASTGRVAERSRIEMIDSRLRIDQSRGAQYTTSNMNSQSMTVLHYAISPIGFSPTQQSRMLHSHAKQADITTEIKPQVFDTFV